MKNAGREFKASKDAFRSNIYVFFPRAKSVPRLK
jgi:hypothetical protein